MPRDYEDDDVLLEGEDDDTQDEPPRRSALSSTPEARTLALSTYQKLSASSPKLDEEEERAFGDYEKSAREIRAQLQAARDGLLKKRQDKSQALLAAAAGLLQPTRTGSVFESAGNALSGALPELQREKAAEQGRQKQALELGTSIGTIDQNLAAQKLKLIQLRRAANGKLLSDSLKIASRPDKATKAASAPRAQSSYGKIAADEGIAQGTPAFLARVQQLRKEDLDLQREKSGVDVSEGLSLEERRGLAAQFGVPVRGVDPYQGLSTKQRQIARQRSATQSSKQLDEIGASINGISKTDNDIDRFLFLNKGVASGKIRGLNPFPGADGDEMDSITARLSRQVRQPGEGQVSNYDAQQFVKGTISRTKPYAANENISKALKLNNQQQRERVKFFNDYASVNDGSIDGAMGAWIQYLDDNPIFDPAAPGSFQLNAKRQSYTDYFKAKNGARFAEGGEVNLEQLLAEDQALNADSQPGEGTVLKGDSKRALQRLQASLQGLTFGLSDELGGLSTAAAGQGYSKGRDYVRRNLEEGSNDIPVSMFGTEMAGSLAPTIAAQQALEKLSKKYAVGRVGRANSRTGRTVQLLTKLAPKSKILKAAATGAVAGGIAGANSEGDFGQRVQRAEDGALFGGALGPIAGKSTELAGKTLRKVFDRVSSAGIGRAEERLADTLARDGVSPATIAAQVGQDARNAVPSRIADFGGPQTQALTESTMARSGPESRALLNDTQQLQSGVRERVEDRVNNSMKPDPYFDQEQKLVQQLKGNAEPLYRAANQVNIPITRDLDAILTTPSGKRAYATALKNMADDGIPVTNAPAGTLNTQVLQYTKEAIGGMIQTAKKGANPNDNAARILTGLQNRLVALVDNVNPAYKKARAQYGDDAEVLGALRLGRTELLDLQPEQIAAQVGNLSFAGRDALRTGVARSLIEEIRTPRRAKNFAEFVNSPVLAQQLGAVFERPQDAKIFIAALQRESQLYGTRAASTRTAQQIQGQRFRNELAGNPGADAVGAAGEGAGIGAAMMGDLSGLQVVSRVLGALRNRITLSDSAAEDIARLLRTGSPAEVNKLMANFEKYSALAKKRRDIDEQLNGTTAGAAAGAFGSANPQGYSQ